MGSCQFALEKIGEMQEYLACVIGMTGPRRHMAKGRKRVCGGLEHLEHAEAGDDADAHVCSPLVGFSTYFDISKLCVLGMEEWHFSDLTTSFLNFVSSGGESSSDDGLRNTLDTNEETLSNCISPLFDFTAASKDDSGGTDIVQGTLSLKMEVLCGQERAVVNRL